MVDHLNAERVVFGKAWNRIHGRLPDVDGNRFDAKAFEGWQAARSQPAAPAQPLIEESVTACGIFHMLVSIMGSDNGVYFPYFAEDRKKVCEPIIAMMQAGYFTGDPEDIDGDFWQMAAGEETEKVAHFNRAHEAFALVEEVLNDIFDRPLDEIAQPSVPSPDDIAYLIQADHEFEACGETYVPYKALMRLEGLGLLQCDHFTVTDAGQKLIAEHGGKEDV